MNLTRWIFRFVLIWYKWRKINVIGKKIIEWYILAETIGVELQLYIVYIHVGATDTIPSEEVLKSINCLYYTRTGNSKWLYHKSCHWTVLGLNPVKFFKNTSELIVSVALKTRYFCIHTTFKALDNGPNLQLAILFSWKSYMTCWTLLC